MSWRHRLFRRALMEEQLDKEIRFHLDQQTADLIASGVAPEEARRQALLAFGGPQQVKEECRDSRGMRWVDDFRQDLHYALRNLRRSPTFTLVSVLTLAVGIGVTTAMFTLINGVLLRPLPYLQPDRLVAIHGQLKTYGYQNLAYLDLLDVQRNSRSLDSAGYLYNEGIIGEPGDPEYVDLREVTSNFFSVLGVNVLQGRAFLPEEDRPGGAPVLVLGYSLWQRRFGGNPQVLSTTVVLNEQHYTVVGIAPASFRLEGIEPDVLIPLGQNTLGFMRNRRAHPIGVVARLRPGMSLAQAQQEISLLGNALAKQYPQSGGDRALAAQPLHPDVGDSRPTLWLLFGAVGVVLLIACVNVASLLLARAISRDRELAMRAALGANRGRLIRQCLTESAALGLCGGVVGLLLAPCGILPIVAFWPGSLPRAEEVHLDWRVALFAFAVSLLSSILFGLAPALRAPVQDLEQRLASGGRSIIGNSRRLHSFFVVSEIALAIVLLVSAGMLGRTMLRLSTVNPGVDTRNVLVTRMALSNSTLADPAKIRAAWPQVLELARRVPGVQDVAMVDTVPMREGNNQLGYWTSAEVPEENKRPIALATCVSPDYLKVMGIPLRKGRFFDDHDRIDTRPIIVIDEVLAQHAFAGRDPVGKNLWIPDMNPQPLLIVGVVDHVRHWGLAGDDQSQVRDQIYYPFAQVPDPLLHRWSELMSIAVRTNVSPLNVVQPLRRELRGDAGNQVLYEVRTMEQLARGTLAQQRFLLLLFSLFAGLALLLACIGIYGVLAYLTTRRVPELGVRMALGATSGNVLWLVLRQGFAAIGAGVAAGTTFALAAGRILMRSVQGMQPPEASTFAVMIPILVVAALIASFLPARRAGRLDPVKALHQE